MNRISLFACACAIQFTPAVVHADDFLPPTYRGLNGSVMVTWEFDAPISFNSPIAADTFSFVPTGISDPNFYTTPRIVAQNAADWIWNPNGSISTTNPAGATLDVIIPGYQGAWDGFARSQYTTLAPLTWPNGTLIPMGWGSSFPSPPAYFDDLHFYQDYIFYQFGSAQILRLQMMPGTSLSELVVDTRVFKVPSVGTPAMAVIMLLPLARRRRIDRDQR